jgi:hypothetical protein
MQAKLQEQLSPADAAVILRRLPERIQATATARAAKIEYPSEHFTWSRDSTQMLGLTPTGRATIDRLQLKREGVVNLPGVLHSIALHPPHNDS